jgi:ElaB/YqjD/DUF883 family membrane-anchored ribosome-binding protein
MANMNPSGSSTVITDAANEVDEAIGTVERGASRRSDAYARQELDALSAEIGQMKASLRRASYASGRAAREETFSLREEFAEQVRSRPLAAVALAAFVGYVYGAAR